MKTSNHPTQHLSTPASANISWSASRHRLLPLGLLLIIALAGCATSFPRPVDGGCCEGPVLTGDAIFERTYLAHGGAAISKLTDVNVALDGRWHFLITRIQPLVTDHRYRVASEERVAVNRHTYAADYRGPAGGKRVYRTKDAIEVQYDDSPTTDTDVLASTALTADSFYLFTLGPLALNPATQQFQRLADAVEKGQRYYRIYTVLEPGLGRSARDELVLWVDADSLRTFRVNITLEGYRTTRGAHVDVTYLEYARRQDYVFPVRFLERVRGPVAIDAHRWHLTGLDINRGWADGDVAASDWRGLAGKPAQPIMPESLNVGAEQMTPKTLYSPEHAAANWQPVNDNVMGGRSQGSLADDPQGFVFQGAINTNGGGFASVRSDLVVDDLADYRGVRLKVLGDGRTYTLLLRDRSAGVSYQLKFETQAGQWQETDLEFLSFRPYRRGTPLNAGPLEEARVDQIGLMINDGVDGDFRLQVALVGLF